jgi:hypothetical protein
MEHFSKRDFLHFLLFSLFLLTSCQKMKCGNVVEKWHEPERIYIKFMPLTISNGKFITTTMVPYRIHDNEDWCVKVTSIDVNGDTITKKYYVDEIAYDTLPVGKFICLGGASDEDTNNQKVRVNQKQD